MRGRRRNWWDTRVAIACFALLSTIPLLWPTLPPLIDLPGHMGRYRVQLDYATSPVLRDFYSFHWSLIGNLGVDLLIIPFAKVFGLELGTKLIVISIPAMTVAGLLWIAREVHGRVPPTALFAVPLAYGHPFLFGFVNFSLSMAFALLAFALWLRLARRGRLRLRAALFLVIGPLIWITHTFGWGTLGVLAFSAELIRQHDRGGSWPRAVVWAGIHCLSLAPPILLMLLWRSGAHVGGRTVDWFNWQAKWLWVITTLRDRYRLYDIISLGIIVLVILTGLRDRRLETSRNLRTSALLLLLVFLLLPRIVFGSAYADMRLTPYIFAVALVSIRMRHGVSKTFATRLALAGLIFSGVRLATTTASLAASGAEADRAMGALQRVPHGARLVTFVGEPCERRWRMSRLVHLPGMAVVRRQAFSNDQWDLPGAQLLSIRKPDAPHYRGDPSQVVTAQPCRREMWKTLDYSLANLPRGAFDYVWIIDPPAYDPRWLRGMTLIWEKGDNALYRIDDRRPVRRTP